MHLILLFVVLVFAAPFILYAAPVIIYVVPFILLGLALSLVTDSVRHHVRATGH